MSDPEDNTGRFTGRVEDYVRYRPGYPQEILALLCDECGLSRDSVLADIGSGTGKLSRMFLENENIVYGVEPNREMREAGKIELAAFDGFRSISGTSEKTELPDSCADFVTVGQAFHWFEPSLTRKEFVRILRPGGWVVVVFNRRNTTTSPFLRDYETIVRKFGKDYEQVGQDKRGGESEVVAFFAPEDVEVARFRNVQRFEIGSLTGRFFSSSYSPARNSAGGREAARELATIFERHRVDGKVDFDYETEVYFGRLGQAVGVRTKR